MLSPYVCSGTFLARLADWWQNVRRRRAIMDEVNQCGEDPAYLARDLGLSASELRTIAAKRPDSGRLLQPRINALGLDRAALGRTYPEVLRDLERVCSLCGKKGICEHDLAANPADPRWRNYCLNAPTFDALQGISNDSSVPSKTKG